MPGTTLPEGYADGIFIKIPSVPGEGVFHQLAGPQTLYFPDQPELTESREAEYVPESLLHANESFNAYQNTTQRKWTIASKFFVRNDLDAINNNNIIHVVRSLVTSDYNNTGAPPVPVRLYAYGEHHLYNVPCLVTGYNFTFAKDVNLYTYRDRGIVIPIVFELSVDLTEQHSIEELRKFSLADFRNGYLVKSGF